MLRKADNATLWMQFGLWGMLTGKHWVHFQVGRQTYRTYRMPRSEFDEFEADQREQACFVIRIGERQYWKFQDRFHWDDEDLTSAQVTALLVTKAMRRTAEVQRAEQVLAMGTMPRQANSRGAIPDDVKHLVWTRDAGACRTCGSGVELQFDHVIPVSMGGSSAPENLQVLCGPCNRRKGARVTG